ncbi:MAG: hypothetical protein K6G27_01505 [Lachnospiraceae bacterium]|nr:hypothetical protein [Lachnospiraceae bacterium]
MKKIDWHSGFVNAMKLELLANENDLEYEDEHLIANRAQRIDLLIIKKMRAVKIVNEVGAIFDKYNIVEYKSPEDSLTLGDFYKILGYTGIYLEELHKYDEYGRDAFTMTFVRRRKPVKLFEHLKRDGHEVIRVNKGIYEIKGHLPFRTQVIVSREWDDEEAEIHTWLRSLTNESKGKELEGILNSTRKLDHEHKRFADGVMNVFARANVELIKEAKEESTMCEAINELFAEETKKEKERADAAIKRVGEVETELGETKTELGETKAKLGETKTELGETKTELGETKAELGETKAELGETRTELGETRTELGKTKTRLSEAMAKIDEMAEQLQDALAEIARLKAAK